MDIVNVSDESDVEDLQLPIDEEYSPTLALDDTALACEALEDDRGGDGDAVQDLALAPMDLDGSPDRGEGAEEEGAEEDDAESTTSTNCHCDHCESRRRYYFHRLNFDADTHGHVDAADGESDYEDLVFNLVLTVRRPRRRQPEGV